MDPGADMDDHMDEAPIGELFGRLIDDGKAYAHAEIDLVPVRCEEWAGCAFINLDNNAKPLRDCLGPVADRMDARHAHKLKMDWWYATELPTNRGKK